MRGIRVSRRIAAAVVVLALTGPCSTRSPESGAGCIDRRAALAGAIAFIHPRTPRAARRPVRQSQRLLLDHLVPADDGTPLDGASWARDRPGVVFAHEYPADLCGWWPFAAYLAHQGLRVLLFDFRCLGEPSCPGPDNGALTSTI